MPEVAHESIRLEDTTLGRLDLTCAAGYAVTEFDVAFPTVRDVSFLRARQDGVDDASAYVGPRAVSLSVVLKDADTPISVQRDRLAGYCHPALRPQIVWRPEGQDLERRLVLRGASFASPFNRPRSQAAVAQWVAPSGVSESASESCRLIPPFAADEPGRVYDLIFDRDYPSSPPGGSLNIVNNGNAPAHWRATIYGIITDPVLVINGQDLAFDRAGGLSISAGDYIVVDSRAATVVDSAGASKYANFDFLSVGWPPLAPGLNTVHLEGASVGAGAGVLFCWRSAWV